MLSMTPRTLRIAIAMSVVWAAAASAAWFTLDPAPALVGARSTGVRAADAALLAQADLSEEQAVLELTNVWGLQRDGQVVVPAAPVVLVEKKIVWSVAATVVRPKERYLLVIDQGTRAITQVKEGEKLPDGSKLLNVALNAYTVRTEAGKKLTVETSL